jgi:cytochrome c5
MADKQYSSRTIAAVTIVVLVVLVAVIWPLSRMGKGSTSAGSGDDVELRIQPVARVEMQSVAPAKSDGKARDGATVYKAVCVACHGTGVAGAPKTGDKAAWAPRIAAGMAALLKNAANGKGAMPPRGGAADLSDAELKAAVDYLTSQAK